MENKAFFKYETHLHTLEGSACAVSGGAAMVDYYKENNYSGFVVTDHFFNGNTAIRRDLSWKKRVNLFCKGYENAKKRGVQLDFDVFFGLEYNFHGTEFLFYGLSPEWLLDHPEIMDGSLSDILKLVRGSGGFVIHAHPFREDSYIEMIRLIPALTDAVEALNAGNMFRDVRQNERACDYAAAYNKPRITGTDIHRVSDSIVGGIASQKRFSDISDMIEAIKTRNCSLIWKGEIIL